MNKLTFLILFLVLTVKCTVGQSNKIDSILQLYSENYQPEKLYLHFDKYMYNKGETIWFKSYILNGTEISKLSMNFYIDFFDGEGKLLKHFIAPVYQSSANGHFDIPMGYKSSFIHVHAYTKWMLNFDSAFQFYKDIVVVQPQKVIPKVTEPIYTLRFFPEGGDLTEGLVCRVGFLAADQSGLPVAIKGKIRNNAGNIIDSFSAVHDGMGSFNIEAKPNEKYTAEWMDAYGKSYFSELPAARPAGMNMLVQPFSSKTLVVISKTRNASDNLKVVYIAAHFAQRLVYFSKLHLEYGSAGVAEIPTGEIPTGVLQITLFNSDWLPVAERVVFINNHHHEFITDVNMEEKSLDKKGRNVMEIAVSDTSSSNLSVAVTDADLPVEKNTIVSQFLLCDDIRGYIHNPSYYFENESDSLTQQLDLVLLTHGWRRFNWKDAFSGTGPVMPNLRDSDYIQIKGKAYTSSNIKIPPDQKVLLILQAKDSSKQSLMLPVNADGSFIQRGVIFYDTLHVYYKYLGTRKLENRSALSFQNGFITPHYSGMDKHYFPSVLGSPDEKEQMAGLQYFIFKQSELQKLMQTTTLKDVVVVGKKPKPVDILDEKYATGLFSGGDAYQFDLVHDTRAQFKYSVFDYLLGMIPGLQIMQVGGLNGWQLSWRGGSPSLYLDEIGIDIRTASTIPLTEIAYVKVFRPPFFGAFGGGAGGAIAMYTGKGGDIKPVPGRGLNYQLLEGYSAYKQFFSPDYSGTARDFTPDTRTTLYWNPYILTNANNKKISIEFYNNDISKRLRIIVEGINADGMLTRTEKIIE